MFEIRLSLPTTVSTTSNNEKSQNTVNKCLYSATDYRSNIYALGECGLDAPSIQTIREQARSVGCIIEERQLPLRQSVYQLDSAVLTLQNRLEKETCEQAKKHNMEIEFVPDEGEKFLDELSAANSTVMLVTKKVILTAAHVICDSITGEPNPSLLASQRVVFDFSKRDNGIHPTLFPKENVYSMRKVIAFQYKKDKEELIEDWALIKLDREVVGRTPVSLEFDTNITIAQQLYMIGFPLGLPQKFTRNGFVKKDNSSSIFEARIDAFSGNSGSPIFDAESKKVVGILCRGKVDLVVDPVQQGRWISHIRRLDSNSQIKSYEFCQKITALFFVKYYILGHQQESSNSEVLFNLACCYDIPKNTGTIQDLPKGFKYLKKAADLGHAAAASAFGSCCLEGIGVTKDEALAVAYLKKGAEAKISEALFLLGKCYLLGQGTERNYKQAIDYFRQASEQQHKKATLFWDEFYSRGGNENETDSLFVSAYVFQAILILSLIDLFPDIDHCKYAAERNSQDSMRQLALCYRMGWGVNKDVEKAFEYAQKLAEQGDVSVINDMIEFCSQKGTQEDIQKAVEWYQKAAGKRDRPPFYKADDPFYTGKGLSKDIYYRFYRYPPFYELGCCYEKLGKHETSLSYFKKAAQLGHKKAKRKLFCAEPLPLRPSVNRCITM